MCSQEKIDELVRRIVDAVHPDKIILFGSTARGTAGPDSDLDVLVIVRDGEDRRARTSAIYRGLLGSKLNADIVVATQADIARYKDSPWLVYQSALREGHELYVA